MGDISAAHTPAARAKRAATMARKKAEKEAAKQQGELIPLDAIPPEEPKRKRKWRKRKLEPAPDAAKVAEEFAMIARRDLMRKNAALNIVRQVLQLLDD